MLWFLVDAAAVIFVILVIVAVAVLIRSDADFLCTFMSKYGKQPEKLQGKVVWITGASSGIGEYIAYCLANAGARLVLSARRMEELERVKAACLSSGKCKTKADDILILPLDMVDFESHKPVVQKVLEYFNVIDVLINNAGKSQRAAWLDVDLSVDRELMELNVFGPVSLTHAVLPHMIERKKGHIAVMSSLAGKIGVPGSRSYDGSKHAVHGYFECLRSEMSEHNIDVTLICPGPVFSKLFVHAVMGKKGEALGREMDPTEKRMTTERCAYLSCVAIANRLYEVWLSKQPILLTAYLGQYVPDFGRWFLKTYGVKKVMALREGK